MAFPLLRMLSVIFAISASPGTVKGMSMSHWQRYDGWYNNLVHPSWGSTGSTFVRKTPVSFADGVYKLAGENRPNARAVSELLFKGEDGLPSQLNRTTMLAFFGQVVAYEMLLGTEMTCPIEMHEVDMVTCTAADNCKSTGLSMPFHRVKYKHETGESVNNPRTQLNLVTSWIDASFVYNTKESIASSLRSFENGTFLSMMDGKYPAYNNIGIPTYNHYAPHLHHSMPIQETYRLGDPRVNQHPAMLAFGVLFFRYHNVVAARLLKENPAWSDDEIFSTARRWVIATMQNIFLYEYVPAFLDEPTQKYHGYNPDIHPGITDLFHVAAFRFSHTLIPPGFYLRDSRCRFRHFDGHPGIRLCNTFHAAQTTIKMYGIEEVLMGMASQIAEREDTVIADDLRESVFGPKQYSRRDLVALNIMRGRDFGLTDYNTARQNFGFDRMSNWSDINPELNKVTPEVFTTLGKLYGSIDEIDLYVGGMLETGSHGIGPLFRAIIKDQFYRLRDGDRFWFENNKNQLFTQEEVARIKATKLYDVILACTNIGPSDIQENVFFWHSNSTKGCPQPMQLRGKHMEKCVELVRHDSFSGSEFFYIFSCVICAVVPILLAGAASVIVKHRVKKTAKIKASATRLCDHEVKMKDALRIKALEWLNGSHSRKVTVQFGPSDSLLVLSRKNDKLRNISLREIFNVIVESNLDTEKACLALIRIPKDHDLVLQFSSTNKRKNFLSMFNDFLQRQGKALEVLGTIASKMYETAETKEKRQKRLEHFFKDAYKEAFGFETASSKDPVAAEELLNTELTKAEFAEVLGMKANSLFIERLFAVTDRDRSGYISYKDFLDTVILFARGTALDKMRVLYNMLNVSQEENLSIVDFEQMIRSLIQTTQSEFSERNVQDLVQAWLSSVGLAEKTELNFEDFRILLQKHENDLGKMGLHLKGTKQVYVPKRSALRTESFRVDTDVFQLQSRQPWLRRRWSSFITYLEDNRQHIFYLAVFYMICIALFVERYTYYCTLSEHKDLRHVMGQGICVTRGAASVISFTYALLVLTVCRHFTTYLRDTVINQYIPLDSAIMFHKVVACTAAFFTAVHTVGHVINFYHVSTQPVEHLACLFKGITFPSGFEPSFQYFLYATIPGLTGLILVILCYALYIFATPVVRLRAFKTFWTTHHLYILIYIITVIHGSARLSGSSSFYMYVSGPIVLFAIDKLITIRKRKLELSIVCAELLPSDVTKVVFNRPPSFLYRSGQWVRVCCPAVCPDEYHSLTLTSAPHENTLSISVKAYGRWTWRLRNILDPANLMGMTYPTVQVDGPYGGGNQEWYKYEVAVMIGGGIGVTPYASILSDLVYGTSTNRYRGVTCRKVYFLWICPTHRSWEWFVDVLRSVEERDIMDVIDVHIFITQYFDNFDLRTMLLYICEKHFQSFFKRSIFTGLKAKNHFGRPQFAEIFKFVRAKHPRVNRVGVFSCGPPALTNSIGSACAEVNTTRQLPNFMHFYENF